jgi:4,5-DOPA dioxygenase extradiol
VPARDFLVALGQPLPRPKAILVVSAHWDTNTPAVNTVAVNETILDFGGFPQILPDQRYPPPGAACVYGGRRADPCQRQLHA